MKIPRPATYLAAAIAAAAIVLIFESPVRPRSDDASAEPLIPGFEGANVERIELSQLLDGAVLERAGGCWRVSEDATPLKRELYAKEGREIPDRLWGEADSSRVSTALGVFGGLERGIVVSTNPKRRDLFQVGAAGLEVRLVDKGGSPVAELVIGKSGPDYGSTYIRRSGADEVYLVRRPLSGIFSPVADDWRKLKTQKDPAGNAPPRDPLHEITDKD
ncbi:MAG: DUF4340 domain-containing protein [Proteobacteria bacterium]|nr:DUF4340 domain-containing protein [Pseudomonadota bacterium]